MRLSLRIILLISAVMLACVTAPLFAESAPVFDADNMQQFDSDSDSSQQQDVPPASNADGGFVPSQPSTVQPQASVSSDSSTSMDQRMRRIEQQMNNIQSNESTARLDSLQNQIQALRDQVEQLTHQLQQVQNQQKITKKVAAGASLATADDEVATTDKPDAKIAAAKQAVKATVGADMANTTASKKSLEDQPNVAEEQQIYQTAYNLIKAKKYNDAVNALQGMLKKYPSGQFASNAHYWLGELYGLMGKNDLALTEFDTVVSTYPDSPRVSDAQLKVGLIYSAQSKWPDAKTSFKKVINHYPGTASARVASEQLKQIKTAGH